MHGHIVNVVYHPTRRHAHIHTPEPWVYLRPPVRAMLSSVPPATSTMSSWYVRIGSTGRSAIAAILSCTPIVQLQPSPSVHVSLGMFKSRRSPSFITERPSTRLYRIESFGADTTASCQFHDLLVIRGNNRIASTYPATHHELSDSLTR